MMMMMMMMMIMVRYDVRRVKRLVLKGVDVDFASDGERRVRRYVDVEPHFPIVVITPTRRAALFDPFWFV